MPSGNLNYKMITPAIGAEFSEFEKGSMVPEIQEQLRELLVDRKVLVFRDQQLTPREFLDFMKTFGVPYAEDLKPQDDNPPEVGVIKIRPNQRQTINFWHMDYSFTERPARILALHAKLIPPCGGDTLITNLEAAYEGLDNETKERIDPLFGNHKLDIETQNAKNRWTREELEEMAKAPPLQHPLVCTNPDNRKNYLFVNVPIFCGSIHGMENMEGDSLLNKLYLHAQRPEYSFRLTWKKDTLVVWENDHCLHYPVSDYFPYERELLRVAIQGVSRPIRLNS
ncbi:MAG: hypothetical protein CMM58_07355 [Rhodospirillaceae bacterium]|nr:hypothetical protein [Rhodospirillaceae bacterium]